MLRRVSANFLLQSVIAVVGIALFAVLASDAIDAWRAVGTAGRLNARLLLCCGQPADIGLSVGLSGMMSQHRLQGAARNVLPVPVCRRA